MTSFGTIWLIRDVYFEKLEEQIKCGKNSANFQIIGTNELIMLEVVSVFIWDHKHIFSAFKKTR